LISNRGRWSSPSLFRQVCLLFWHAPLGVRSTKRRHQSPEWTILSHVNCFTQWEIVGFQVLVDTLHPRSTRGPGHLLQFCKDLAVKIFLASFSSSPTRRRKLPSQNLADGVSWRLYLASVALPSVYPVYAWLATRGISWLGERTSSQLHMSTSNTRTHNVVNAALWLARLAVGYKGFFAATHYSLCMHRGGLLG